MEEINFYDIEKKWQTKWDEGKIFSVKEEDGKKKYYVLEMFPYPSASGLHMGHTFNYTIGDIFSRFKIMQGYNVLHPGGFDSLGLPAENAAIKEGIHPEDYTKNSIANFIRQQKRLGLTYDWDRVINTSDSNYYKWDQWIFLKMFEKGLAYQKETAVNWCSDCNTVLANEQAQGGFCDRCGNKIEIKQLKQWFLKITDYADKLLDGHKNLNWPEKTITMQKNWIGKSYGYEIEFEINGKKWPVFTTRPDTIFGATFMVISTQHKGLMELVTPEQKEEVLEFLEKLGSVSEKEMAIMEKMGIFTGSYAVNPANGEKIPVYAGNFVVADYGAGLIMAVPAHDKRDFDFAKKYGIEIRQVIVPVFKSEDENKPRDDKKTVHRNSIMLVVKHPSEEKYLHLKWNKFDWRCLVQGGVNEGEDFFDAAKRELIEETGYCDIKEIEKLPFDMDNVYFAAHKDENRYTHVTPLYIELASEEKQIVDEKESEQFVTCWAETKDLEGVFGEAFKHHFWLVGQVTGNTTFCDFDGVLINSGDFNGIDNELAKEEIFNWLKEKGVAKRAVNYRLRDWCISRQRYWGTPIPLIECDKCGIVPVPEEQLPVVLPKDVKFGKGNPLLTKEDWLNVDCPECGGKAKRISDTMDTFVNSSWYFLRFCDSKNNKKIFSKDKVKYWMPVDLYIGGAEHACMHLLFHRFYTMFLHDIGLVEFDEPTPRLFHQGMINDEHGEKMSKSKGNIIEPLETMKKYGVDTTRFFMISEASPDKGFNWSQKSIQGSLRFVKKLSNILNEIKFGEDSNEMLISLNNTIKNVTEKIENIDFRSASIDLRELYNKIIKEKEVSKKTIEIFLRLLSPFCPHICEELWERLGHKNFISLETWPKMEEIKLKKVNNKEEYDVNNVIIESVKLLKEKYDIKKLYVYVMPFEYKSVNNKLVESKFEFPVEIYAVNDSNKFDPEGKAKNAKPQKPSFYF